MSGWFKRMAMGGIVAAALLSPAMAEDDHDDYPAIGMMGGGCPVMGMGGYMMGPGMMGQMMMGPGGQYMAGPMMGGYPGMMGPGMMGWSGAGGQGYGYQGMMGNRQAGGANTGDAGKGAAAGWPRMEAVVEGRLAYLRAELGITTAENDAWNAYAEAVRGRVSLMRDTHQQMFKAMAQGTAVDRMNARIQGMESMLSAMKAMQPTVAQLYKVLSDDQKRLADRLIGLDCGGM